MSWFAQDTRAPDVVTFGDAEYVADNDRQMPMKFVVRKNRIGDGADKSFANFSACYVGSGL